MAHATATLNPTTDATAVTHSREADRALCHTYFAAWKSQLTADVMTEDGLITFDEFNAAAQRLAN